MQTDGRFIQNIETPDERAAERVGQADTLRLTATECVGQPVKGQILQPHLIQIPEALADLVEDLAGDPLFPLAQFKLIEKPAGVADGHLGDFTDMESPHLDIEGIFAHPVPFTDRAAAIATIPGIEHPHMNLVELAFDLSEKTVDADIHILAIPDDIFHL